MTTVLATIRTVLLYYITDRRQFPGPEPQRRQRLLRKIGEAARAGVDYIQLREKDLPAREVETLARDAVRICREVRSEKPGTKLLINSRSDIALVTRAKGVQLPSTDILASDARAVWSAALTRNSKLEIRDFVVAVSCHTADEVRLAEAQGADFAVFGPVFEKVGSSLSAGLEALRAACHRRSPADPTGSAPFDQMPVLAVGGVTLENARACIEVGAAGIAAIRLFQENDPSEVVKELRGL
jgi:thiamine-phosphate pyrophosphorylase